MHAETICKNCGNRFMGNFCNECGEKVYTEHDKTFGHFLEEGFHFITHFDSKLVRTWWLVMTRPGFVSGEIAAGVRKPYYKPLNLFIIGVILYLLFPYFQGLNMQLQYHVYGAYGPVARALINQKMESHHLTFPQLAEIFDHKSPKFAKILLLIIIPLSGLLLQLLFLKKRRFYFDHVTLAAEYNTFYLYLSFLIIPGIYVLARFIAQLFSMETMHWGLGDYISIPLYIIVSGMWCSRAFQRFYNEKKGWAIFKSVLFLILHAVVVYVIYRFILLLLVLLFI